MIGVGSFRPLPQNRTGGSPAYGLPVIDCLLRGLPFPCGSLIDQTPYTYEINHAVTCADTRQQGYVCYRVDAIFVTEYRN